MALTFKSELLRAYGRLLRPLVRILLRNGVAYGEFAEIVKQVYVEIAREDFSLPGKKPTDSRVAILTGLTRKDVKNLRDKAGELGEERPGQANRATRVLSGWHQDADFCGADGQPLDLPLEAGSRNFTDLVRRYSGDMPPRAMLEELLRVNAVALDPQGRVHVLNRSYVPNVGDPEGARMLGYAVRDLASSIDHNLSRDEREPPYFQRTVFSNGIPERALPIFRRIVSERGQRFLEGLDDWLSSHESEATAAGEDADTLKHTGVGIYFFQGEPRKDKS
jgi:hypothetical protein